MKRYQWMWNMVVEKIAPWWAQICTVLNAKATCNIQTLPDCGNSSEMSGASGVSRNSSPPPRSLRLHLRKKRFAIRIQKCSASIWLNFVKMRYFQLRKCGSDCTMYYNMCDWRRINVKCRCVTIWWNTTVMNWVGRRRVHHNTQEIKSVIMNIRKWNKNVTEHSNRTEELRRNSTRPCNRWCHCTNWQEYEWWVAEGDEYCGAAEPCPVAIVD